MACLCRVFPLTLSLSKGERAFIDSPWKKTWETTKVWG